MIRTAALRNLVALEASSERFALTVSIARRIDGDRWVIPVRTRGGSFEGPVERLRAPCDGNDTIAVDGDRIAVASTCGVAIHAPAGVTTIGAGEVRNVALAGRYLAWTGWQRMAWAAPGTPGARRLDAAPHFDGLRRAGGRVLYERRSGPRHGRRVLLLRASETSISSPAARPGA